MGRLVALLRSVNVAGRKVAMADVKRTFSALGFDDVATYLQSGNVTFSTSGRTTKPSAARIEQALRKECALDIAVILRSRKEMSDAITANPFVDRGCDPAALHVTFLTETPAAARRNGITVSGACRDEFHIAKREVYLYCPDGYGRTKLNNAFWERQLATTATTRNWRSVTNLLAQLDG